MNAQVGIPPFFSELRKRKSMTLETFASRMGVTLPTINGWENGCGRTSPLAMQ